MANFNGEIKAIVMHGKGGEARYPVENQKDALSFVAEMVLGGFVANQLGQEVHLVDRGRPGIPQRSHGPKWEPKPENLRKYGLRVVPNGTGQLPAPRTSGTVRTFPVRASNGGR